MMKMIEINNTKKMALVLCVLLSLSIFILYPALLVSALSVDTTMNDTISSDFLLCSWEISADVTDANISWYNGSVYYNFSSVLSPQIRSSSLTYRGQTWDCNIFITNGTSTTNDSVSANIINSPPSNPTLKNSSGDTLSNFTNLDENNFYEFTLISTDYDDDPITYVIITGQPDNSNFSSDGTFNWTPTYEQGGSNNVTFMASDGFSGSQYKKVNFNVTLLNDDPYFNPALSSQEATEGQSFSYSVTAADEESNYPIEFFIESPLGSRLIITNTSSTEADITFNVSGSDEPEFQDRGYYQVNVSINDTMNGTNSSYFFLNVSTVNHAPNMTFISNQTGTQGQAFQVVVNATDLDNDTLVFSINDSYYSIATSNISDTFFGTVNISSLNNTHVMKRWVQITVSDTKETFSQKLIFNFTNTNDAPEVFEMSFYSINTQTNQNMSNLTGYINTPFVFRVNVTDVDNHTYEGEVLSFSSNNSNFTINSSTGIFSFTPLSSQLGNFSINVSVTDDQGLNVSRVMNLSIKYNNPPYFEHNITNMTCYEDNLCNYDVNASDPDIDDYVNYSTNISFVLINQSGVIEFTPNVTQIGEYSVNLTVTDSREAFNSTVFNLEIINSNDDPILANVVFPDPIASEHEVTVYLDTYDEDLRYNTSFENLTYSVNISGPNSTLFNISSISNNQTGGLIQFTPTDADSGNYSLNISVNDSLGAFDFQVVNIYIYNQSSAPLIQNITPWGMPKSAVTNFTFTKNNFNGSSTLVSIPENSTVVFNHTTIDNDTTASELNITWYFNRTNETATVYNGSWNLTKHFNFFSNGSYYAKLEITDNFYETSTFIWNITIINLNRAPKMITLPSDLEVAGSNTAFTNYFTYFNSSTIFIDPDDDVNSNNLLDANETNRLNFSATDCSYATFLITGSTLQVNPISIGVCQVYFNATDSDDAFYHSQLVNINITNNPDTDPQPTPTSSGGGGSSRTQQVPVPQDVDVPMPVHLIVPQSVSIYVNQTVEVPITVENNWTVAIKEVTLSAETNVTDVEFYFSRNYWSEIGVGETRETNLVITNYRSPGTYEILVKGQVLDPEFEDQALILVNSIESFSEGEEIEQRIRFARDILNENPECQELNELLDKAGSLLAANDFKGSLKMIDSVINGCKYIVNNLRDKKIEEPKSIVKTLLNLKKDYYIFAGSFLIVILGMIASVTILDKVKKNKTRKEEE